MLPRTRTLQRQDAAVSYSYPEPGPDPRSCYPGLPRGHSYDTATWARDPRAEPPPPPAPRTQAETGWASGSSGAGGRRRLPDESLVTKRRPWQGGLSLLTGWSQDDLTRDKAANSHAHYGNGTNGYQGEIIIACTTAPAANLSFMTSWSSNTSKRKSSYTHYNHQEYHMNN